jgi:FkbM family methyltransferase
MARAPLSLLAKLQIKKSLSKLRRRLIGTHVTALLTETANGLLLVPADDFAVARSLARGGYNQQQLEAIDNLQIPKPRILIVGAHIGALLVPLAGSADDIVGIEANPTVFELLKRNVALNSLRSVQIFHIAALDVNGEIEFLKNTVNSGGSKIQTAGKRPEFLYDSPELCRVPSKRLDDVFPDRVFDLIVMDIEGSEYRALRGMPRILSATQALMLEVLPNHIDNIARVSVREFLEVLPDSLSCARVIGGSKLYVRGEFPGMFEEIWRTAYFDGRDVLFSRS